MKWFTLLHCHKLSCSCYVCIAYHCLEPFIYSYLKTNRDVSELVKFATRSGIVSHVGKVVAPVDCDNII